MCLNKNYMYVVCSFAPSIGEVVAIKYKYVRYGTLSIVGYLNILINGYKNTLDTLAGFSYVLDFYQEVMLFLAIIIIYIYTVG